MNPCPRFTVAAIHMHHQRWHWVKRDTQPSADTVATIEYKGMHVRKEVLARETNIDACNCTLTASFNASFSEFGDMCLVFFLPTHEAKEM